MVDCLDTLTRQVKWHFGAMESHAVASIEMHSGRADLEK